MSGPYSGDLRIVHCGLWVVEISEEAAWLHVSSTFPKIHILCFSTEHLSKPILLVSRYGVRENEDNVLLTCYTNRKSPQWLLNGRDLKLTDRMRMSMDGRRLTINPVRREDAGVYKCKVSNPIMSAGSQGLQLYVYYEWPSFLPLCYWTLN